MRGKTVVVTGATDGVGKEAAKRIAAAGATLLLVSRNADKGGAVVERMRRETGNEAVSFLRADLSHLDEVRRVAGEIRARSTRLDVLLNNAGAIFMRRRESADGIEMTWALNHLGYFLLTHELLDPLKASAPARIVNVASAAHHDGIIDFDDLEGRRAYSGLRAYARSKLANVLFTYELARRLEGSGVTANALHPGFVRTRIGSNNGLLARLIIAAMMRVKGISVAEGGKTSVYLATSSEVAGASGGYYERCALARSSAASRDETVARAPVAGQRRAGRGSDMSGAPNLRGPVRPPAGGTAEMLVVLLHGLGADGNDLIGLAPHWAPRLPAAEFSSPHAPEPCDMAPFGRQWFSLKSRTPEAILDGAEHAAPILDEFIDRELARLGLGDDRLALVGFSQGTMMALHAGLRRGRPPAAIVGFSGSLVASGRLAAEARGRPPVLLVHGDADEIVPVSALHDAVAGLSAAGIGVIWHVCPGMGHQIDGTGLEMGGAFLAAHLLGPGYDIPSSAVAGSV